MFFVFVVLARKQVKQKVKFGEPQNLWVIKQPPLNTYTQYKLGKTVIGISMSLTKTVSFATA